MKKTWPVLAAILLLAGASVAQDARREAAPPAPAAVAASVERIDSETRALVARIYPAFVQIGGGSGVCISEDGYFVTNHHVWSGAVGPATMPVRMAGSSRAFVADSVGADPRGDIVLGKIRLGEGEKVPFAPLGDSEKVRVGDICIAIGNPFILSGQPGSVGAEPTVTMGTVVANRRYQGGYNAALQIDAPINPGNSGGPTFNLDGEVIGINGRNISSHGMRFNTGAGFAIPSSQVRNFMDAFKANEGGARLVRHGVVGGLQMEFGLNRDGARVREVEAGSHAQKAGFQPGDVIVSMDGNEVRNSYRYYSRVGLKPRDSQFTFKVRRGEELLDIVARNDVPVENGQMRFIPRAADEIPVQEAQAGQFPLPPARSLIGAMIERNGDAEVGGLVVNQVVEGGALAAAGLAAGDVIVEFNGRAVNYRTDLMDILIAVEGGTEVKVKYIREGKQAEATVVTAAAPAPRRRFR